MAYITKRKGAAELFFQFGRFLSAVMLYIMRKMCYNTKK